MSAAERPARAATAPRQRGTGQSATVATVAPADVEQPAQPAHPVNVTAANPYRYDTGGQFGRAMYERRRTDVGDHYWQHRADLPCVHARIVRRDGSQRRTGTSYLISAEPESARVIVSDDDLTTGAWAVKVGGNLSSDRHIITAAGTAIRDMAHRTAPEIEATPRPDVYTASGHLDLPAPECLPDGYLRTPPVVAEADIIAALRAIVAIAGRNPRMALVMGASAASPYIGPLHRQAHWYDLHGEQRMGKTTAHTAAAVVWGDPRLGTGIIIPWNASSIGTGRHLGQLGILPPFLDERGLAPFSREQWGELVYATCQGSSRLTAEIKGEGTRRSAPWFGVLFSTGNARLLDGLGAGRFAGVPARVVELAAPFTADAAESDAILKKHAARAYGWLGPRILAAYPAPMVARLIDEASGRVGQPDGGEARTIAEHLHAAVAGAVMVDAVLGTDSTLTDAALTAAREHLAVRWRSPEHDADRMATAIGESLFARRSAWPTEADYIEAGRPHNGVSAGATLPQHGIDREILGIRSDDGQRVYVFTGTWQAIGIGLDVDSSTALGELYRRGHLHVAASQRAAGKWTDRPRVGGVKLSHVYNLATAGLDLADDGDQGQEPTGPAGPVTVEPTDQGHPASQEPLPLDQESATAGPCARCLTPGKFCGFGRSTDDAAPCVLCGQPTHVRARCGAARTAMCHGQEHDQEPARPAPAASPRRGTFTEKIRAEQVTLLETIKARLDAGTAPKLLAALEGPYRPLRRGEDGRMHGPFWRPELPGITEAVHTVTGYAWERKHDGPALRLDRNMAWPTATSSVRVAHGSLEHVGPLDDYTGQVGFFKVPLYPWTEQDMPHPLGSIPAGCEDEIWLPGPLVALLKDLDSQDRWPGVAILDAYVGDGVRLDKWAHLVRELRTYARETYGKDSDQDDAVKESFGMATSLMRGTDQGAGQRRQFRTGVQRPDWTMTIQAQASATLWRRADECRTRAPDLAPVAMRNIDELWIPADALDTLTTDDPRTGRPTIAIDESGLTFGTFKVKHDDEGSED